MSRPVSVLSLARRGLWLFGVLLTLGGMQMAGASIIPNVCTVATAINLLAPTSQVYSNGNANGGPKSAGASVYAAGYGFDDNSTYTQPVPLITNALKYSLGVGTGNHFLVDLRWGWSNGFNEPSSSATLTLVVNGTPYAVLTTPNDAGTVGSIAPLVAGTTVSQPVVNQSGAFVNPVTTSTVTLPANVTSIASISMVYSNSIAGGDSGDDVNYNLDSVYACPPTIKLAKISNGGTGPFTFDTSPNAQVYNGTVPSGTPTHDSVTTTAVGMPATSSANTVVVTSAPGISDVSVTEAVTTGYALASVSCEDANYAGTFGTLSGTTLTIPAANIKSNSKITCTFTNNKVPKLSLQKALPNERTVAGDQFTLALTGATSVTTTGTGSAVTSAPVTNINATIGTPYTFSETGANGANLANYTTTYSCTNALSGGQTPSGNGTSFTVTPVVGDDLSCTFTNVALVDVGILKTGPAYVAPSGNVTYTLTVTNTLASPAATVVVSDPLPAGTTFVRADNGGIYNSVTRTVTWNLGTLAGSATQTLTVDVTAPDKATVITGTKVLTNTATISATNDSNSGNNSSSATTQLILSDLSKTVQNIKTGGSVGTSSSGLPKDVLEYCLAFRNLGGADLPNFQITDQVPANMKALLTGISAAPVFGYDTAANTAGFAGSGYGVRLTRGAVTSYLTSASDADNGTLTSSGGTYSSGTLTANLGTLKAGETGTVCFRTAIQ